MKKNVRPDSDAGSMLSQKTNEDFNKKKPIPADLKSKTYQKDSIHANPGKDQDTSRQEVSEYDNQKTKNKTDDVAGAEFIASK